MATYHFRIHHHGEFDKMGLAAMLQEYAKAQRFADHMTPDQAAEVLLNRYREMIESELAQIDVQAIRQGDEPATGEVPGGPPPPDAPF